MRQKKIITLQHFYNKDYASNPTRNTSGTREVEIGFQDYPEIMPGMVHIGMMAIIHLYFLITLKNNVASDHESRSKMKWDKYHIKANESQKMWNKWDKM